jgi:Protein of unknown function (DUF3606)
MPDSYLYAGPVDFNRVDLTEVREFRYWTDHFACTPQQWIEALGSVGVEAAAVGRYFAATRPS